MSTRKNPTYIDQEFGALILTNEFSPGIAADPIRPIRMFRKKARIIGLQMTESFDVETNRGVMHGVSGDWLVRNHPDDDPGTDIWCISDGRMKATYEEME